MRQLCLFCYKIQCLKLHDPDCLCISLASSCLFVPFLLLFFPLQEGVPFYSPCYWWSWISQRICSQLYLSDDSSFYRWYWVGRWPSSLIMVLGAHSYVKQRHMDDHLFMFLDYRHDIGGFTCMGMSVLIPYIKLLRNSLFCPPITNYII